MLFDEKMREHGLNARAVNGYDREVSSALTAASLVARGAADVCIGSERVFHQVEGVDFLPLQDEWLDIAFLENERSIPVVSGRVLSKKRLRASWDTRWSIWGKQFINVNLHECGYGTDHRFFVC